VSRRRLASSSCPRREGRLVCRGRLVQNIRPSSDWLPLEVDLSVGGWAELEGVGGGERPSTVTPSQLPGLGWNILCLLLAR
jgi:hypothetical protein